MIRKNMEIHCHSMNDKNLTFAIDKGIDIIVCIYFRMSVLIMERNQNTTKRIYWACMYKDVIF